MSPISKEELENAIELLDFIDASPTAFQAVDEEKALLLEAGFQELSLTESWDLQPQQGYFVEVGGAALVAFRLSADQNAPFHIVGAHNDSPTYQLKESTAKVSEGMVQLNVEPYGGMIHRTWFDRPLSVAGRVFVKNDEAKTGVDMVKVKVEKPLLIIPSLAIHMDREVNNEGKISPQKMMLPVLSMAEEGEDLDFLDIIAEEAELKREDILDFDLFLYDLQDGCILGAKDEFLSCGQLDNLASSHAAVRALIASQASNVHQVITLHDNEEVGSNTRRGADSNTFRDILRRIHFLLGGNEETFVQALAQSLMISVDMAHAVHPSFPEMADPTNRPRINQGPVVKYSAAKSYATESEGVARLRRFAAKAGVPLQTFHNHSDKKGGSTIGAISEQWTSIINVDIGNPMLAMHSVRELAGVKDHTMMIALLTGFMNNLFK